MKFFIKDFFSKCDQVSKKLRIWSQLLKKSLMENFFFCAVYLKSELWYEFDFLHLIHKYIYLIQSIHMCVVKRSWAC